MITGFGLVLVEEIAHFLHWLVVASVGTAEDDVDADGVFVDVFHGFLGVESVVAFHRDGDESAFDLV